jgi:hypothetical protein
VQKDCEDWAVPLFRGDFNRPAYALASGQSDKLERLCVAQSARLTTAGDASFARNAPLRLRVCADNVAFLGTTN